MAIGVLYKRFLAGAKGWEQIPLITYYREFGNIEAVSGNNPHKYISNMDNK